MTEHRDIDKPPWWESELSAINRELRTYLNRRLPALRADHEDLIGDTLLGLTREVRRRSTAFPKSWFQSTTPVSEAERSHLHKLAMVILRRRIADLFRKRTTLPVVMDKQGLELGGADAPDLPRQILHQRILEVTLSVLAELRSEDRDLVTLAGQDGGYRRALSARERQRLHRAREKIRRTIVQHFGSDIKDLLNAKP